MSAVCNFVLPLLQENVMITTAARDQREKLSHCRFCAKEKKCMELLDLIDDKETLDFYIMILKFFQIDFVDFSIEEIPKTTCEPCYNMIEASYNFFLHVKESQIVLNNLYSVKKEYLDVNFIKTEHIDVDGQPSTEEYKDDGFSYPMMTTNTVEFIVKSEHGSEDVLNIPSLSQTTVDHLDVEHDSNNSNTESENLDEDIAVKIASKNSYNNNVSIEGVQNLNKTVDTFQSERNVGSFALKTDSKQIYGGIPDFFQKGYNAEKFPNIISNNECVVDRHLENVNETIEMNEKDGSIPLPSQTDALLRYGGLPVFLENDDIDNEKIAVMADDDRSWKSYPWFCKYCQVELDSMEELRLHGLQLHKKCYSFKCVDCDLDVFNMFNPFIEHVRQHFDHLRYYCPHCNVRFDCTSECTAHLLSHWSDGQRICEWCGEICKDGVALKVHKRLSEKTGLTKHIRHKRPRLVTTCRQYKRIPVMLDEPALGTWDDYEWTCQDCSLRLPSVHSLREHTQQLHDKCFSMKCVDCLRVLTHYSSFTSHVSEHRPYLKNYCIYCNEHVDEKGMEKHVDDHRTSEQKPCDECGQILQNKEFEKQHLEQFQPRRRAVNITTEDLTCDICKKVCANLSILRSHKQIHNKNRKKDHVCPSCGAQFFYNYNLEFHIAAKHGDKNNIHICKVCNKKFSIEAYLRKHISRMHTAKQKFICDHCSKEFNSKSNLTIHIIGLTKNNKNNKCNVCSKLYYSASGLKIHMNTHTGARPYQCRNCDKTFTNWANCNKHMLRIHGTTLCKTKLTKHGRVPIDVVDKVEYLAPDVKDWLENVTKKKVAKRKGNTPSSHRFIPNNNE